MVITNTGKIGINNTIQNIFLILVQLVQYNYLRAMMLKDPTNLKAGLIRFNKESSLFEGYSGQQWMD